MNKDILNDVESSNYLDFSQKIKAELSDKLSKTPEMYEYNAQINRMETQRKYFKAIQTTVMD